MMGDVTNTAACSKLFQRKCLFKNHRWFFVLMGINKLEECLFVNFEEEKEYLIKLRFILFGSAHMY